MDGVISVALITPSLTLSGDPSGARRLSGWIYVLQGAVPARNQFGKATRWRDDSESSYEYLPPPNPFDVPLNTDGGIISDEDDSDGADPATPVLWDTANEADSGNCSDVSGGAVVRTVRLWR